MKRLESINDPMHVAELEVIECDCGYHMGIDASFVGQVHDAFFAVETKCPSCGTLIPVRDILEMEPIEMDVEVMRSCSAFQQITVRANSLEQAKDMALDEAGDHEFSEKDADYEATGGWYLPRP